MSSDSPTVEGFRLLFRRPLVPAAEIAWRWAFAGALWFLTGGYLAEYANTLKVDAGTRLLLRSGQPVLIGRALRHVFSGSAIRFVAGLVVVSLALLILWMAVASLGRLATLQALGEELGGPEVSSGRRSSALLSLLDLNLLRAAAALAAVLAASGMLLAMSSIWAHSSASGADMARLWFAGVCLVWSAWAILNWFLATASVFVVAHQRSAFAALDSLAAFCQEQLGAVVVVGIWFGLAHIVSLVLACAFGFMVLSLLGSFGPAPLVVIEFLIAVVYFAIADFLFMGRLAAYMALMGGRRGMVPTARSELLSGPSAGRIDQSELILSDVPV
jgi:hypothetical protein